MMIMSQENFDDLVKSRIGSDEFWKTSFHPNMARMIFWKKINFWKKVSFSLTKVDKSLFGEKSFSANVT